MLVPFYNVAALQKNTHLHIKISSASLKKHFIKPKKKEEWLRLLKFPNICIEHEIKHILDELIWGYLIYLNNIPVILFQFL